MPGEALSASDVTCICQITPLLCGSLTAPQALLGSFQLQCILFGHCLLCRCLHVKTMCLHQARGDSYYKAPKGLTWDNGLLIYYSLSFSARAARVRRAQDAANCQQQHARYLTLAGRSAQAFMLVLKGGVGHEHLSVFDDALKLVEHLLANEAFLPDHRVLFVVRIVCVPELHRKDGISFLLLGSHAISCTP